MTANLYIDTNQHNFDVITTIENTNGVSGSTSGAKDSKDSKDSKEPERPPLPKRLRIKGGMTSGKKAGNGIHFDADALAALASSKPNAPYVVDHGMGISSIAGMVKKVSAERGEMSLDIVSGERKGKKKKVPWSYLTHESVLTEDFPAYEKTAASILAHSKNGMVPQESIALQAHRLLYDEETDRLILGGPYRLIHHSHVSRGAFGPEDQVGITSIEYSASPDNTQATVTVPSDPESFNAVLITNFEDLALTFCASASAPALAALERTGLYKMAAKVEKKPDPLSVVFELEEVPLDGESLNPADSNTQAAMNVSEDQAMPTPTEPAQKTDAQASVSISPAELQALREKAEAGSKAFEIAQKMQQDLAAKDAQTLSSERERLLAEYAGILEKSDVDSAASLAALRSLEAVAKRAGTKRTPADPLSGKTPEPAKEFDAWGAHYAEFANQRVFGARTPTPPAPNTRGGA